MSSIPIVLAIAAAAANVLGGWIVTWRRWGKTSLRYFMAIGSGFMLGTVFLEMIPESTTLNRSAGVWVLAGYLLVHLFEHTFAPHLHFGEETHHDEMAHPLAGVSALVGMIVHTFLDGVAIGSGFLVSGNLGVLISLAILLHKIPDGFTIASIVMSSGRTQRQALGACGLLGVSTVFGVIAAQTLSGAALYFLPLSTGSLLYVAATDLMPEVNREPGVRMAVLAFVGTALFIGAQALLPHAH